MNTDPNNNYECQCARCDEHFRGNRLRCGADVAHREDVHLHVGLEVN